MNNVIKDETYEAKAWAYGLSVYAVILLLLYFVKIVYNPPREEVSFGVDLNYGIDLVGYGDIQTTNRASDSKNNYDVLPAAGERATSPEPPVVRPNNPTNTPPRSSRVSNILTGSEDTKVTVKKSESSENSSNKSVTPAPPAQKTTPAAPPTPPRTVDQGSIMKRGAGGGGSSNSNGTTGTRSGVGGNNNGDGRPGDVGDQGDPRGTLDGKSLYGTPGSGGGSGTGSSEVRISGWKNKARLNINKDQSNETGTIIFDVVINDFGDVISIKNRATSLSPSVVNYYRNQISSKLKATLEADGTPPSRSTGTITIRITRG